MYRLSFTFKENWNTRNSFFLDLSQFAVLRIEYKNIFERRLLISGYHLPEMSVVFSFRNAARITLRRISSSITDHGGGAKTKNNFKIVVIIILNNRDIRVLSSEFRVANKRNS